MNLLLFGAPGAGKGTQANNIVNNFNLKQVSTGQLLRNEIKLQTKLGKKIESTINKGELASDEVVNSLIEKFISDPKNFNRIIFDGYPRNMTQIHSLEKILKKYKQKLSAVLYLSVNKDIISKRIMGRITCDKCNQIFNEYFNPPNFNNLTCKGQYFHKRTDDKIETIINRFETYVIKTRPVLDYYRKNSLFYEIDGNNEIDEIYNKIKAILKNLRD